MKHSTPSLSPLLALPALLIGMVGCGGAETRTELRDPATHEVVGHYDGTQQAYVFDTDTVPVWRIDTYYVGPDEDVGEPGAPLRAPSSRADNDGLAPNGDLEVAEDQQCWQFAMSDDGHSMFCRGCCDEEECREVCTDLSPEKAAAAMMDWRSLDTPEPRPPR